MNNKVARFGLIIGAALAIASLPLNLNAQSSSGTYSPLNASSGYKFVSITTPVTYLLAGASSNLASGWSSESITTNTTITWSSSSSAFTTNTTYTTNSSTQYATFDATGARYVVLQWDNHCSGSSTENAYISVQKSATGTRYDYGGTANYTNSANGTNANGMTFLIDMAGYGYGRITKMAWLGASVTLTNDGTSYSKKPVD